MLLIRLWLEGARREIEIFIDFFKAKVSTP
jgi:hypothetical protein